MARRTAAKLRRRGCVQVDSRIMLVHTPVHASWRNQVEIYFSIIQRKVLTPNDCDDLEAARLRLAWYKSLTSTSHAFPVEVRPDQTDRIVRKAREPSQGLHRCPLYLPKGGSIT